MREVDNKPTSSCFLAAWGAAPSLKTDLISPGWLRKSALQTKVAEQTNKWAAEQPTAAGTISRAAGPPDKSPDRCPNLNTCESLWDPQKVRLHQDCWPDLLLDRMTDGILSLEQTGSSPRAEQVLHWLPGCWWTSWTEALLLILINEAGRSIKLLRTWPTC